MNYCFTYFSINSIFGFVYYFSKKISLLLDMCMYLNFVQVFIVKLKVCLKIGPIRLIFLEKKNIRKTSNVHMSVCLLYYVDKNVAHYSKNKASPVIIDFCHIV